MYGKLIQLAVFQSDVSSKQRKVHERRRTATDEPPSQVNGFASYLYENPIKIVLLVQHYLHLISSKQRLVFEMLSLPYTFTAQCQAQTHKHNH